MKLTDKACQNAKPKEKPYDRAKGNRFCRYLLKVLLV